MGNPRNSLEVRRLKTWPMTISDARGASLYDLNGVEYLDLCMGFGSAMIGHGNKAVSRALQRQLLHHASPGFLDTDIGGAIIENISRWLPHSHVLTGVYGSGTEAVELAMRIAVAHTGRSAIAGFQGAHHGRTFLAGALGAVGHSQFSDQIHALPFPPRTGSQEIVVAWRKCLEQFRPAALFVEPIHMSGGGYCLADEVLQSIVAMSQEQGCLVVFDELLTGGYRSGPRFCYQQLGITPDILVAGKALGGGFPSALLSASHNLDVRNNDIGWRNTFTNHPLSVAAIDAATDQLERMNAAFRVRQLGEIIESGISVNARRGRGAMWCVEWPDPQCAEMAFKALLEKRIVTSFSGRYLRLLPSLVIEDEALIRVCEEITLLLDKHF